VQIRKGKEGKLKTGAGDHLRRPARGRGRPKVVPVSSK